MRESLARGRQTPSRHHVLKGIASRKRQETQPALNIEIDNVFLLRKARRLPFDRRSNVAAVEAQHKDFPISSDVMWAFKTEIQQFVDAVWYDPTAALARGSFV